MQKIVITKMAFKTCQFWTKVASVKKKAVPSFAFIFCILASKLVSRASFVYFIFKFNYNDV